MAALAALGQQLTRLEGELKKMASGVQELDAALTAYETAEAAQIAEMNQAINAILAKVSPTIDLGPEIARLTTAQANWQATADAFQQEAGLTPGPSPAPPPARPTGGPTGRRH